MDQDNQAEFINTHYEKLQPAEGANTFKHGLSKFIVDYAKEHTNLHLIISNSIAVKWKVIFTKRIISTK